MWQPINICKLWRWECWCSHRLNPQITLQNKSNCISPSEPKVPFINMHWNVLLLFSSLYLIVAFFWQLESASSCYCCASIRTQSVCIRTYRWWSICSWTTRIRRKMGISTSNREWCWSEHRSRSQCIGTTSKVTAELVVFLQGPWVYVLWIEIPLPCAKVKLWKLDAASFRICLVKPITFLVAS